MKFYEYDERISQIFAEIEESGGEITEDQREALDALFDGREQKLDGTVSYYKDMTSDINALDEEIKNLTARKKALQNRAESLKAYIGYVVNGEKWENEHHKISFRKSQAVVIDNEDDFRAFAEQNDLRQCLTYKEPEINKTAVKDAIKLGYDVKFARIEDRQSIQIK